MGEEIATVATSMETNQSLRSQPPQAITMPLTSEVEEMTSNLAATRLHHTSLNQQSFVLPFSLLSSLSKLLNYDHPLGNDWRGLASLLDLTAEHVYNIERKENPTREVLEIWREQKKTITDLKAAFEEMGRSDCADVVQKCIEKGPRGEGGYRFLNRSPVVHPTDQPDSHEPHQGSTTPGNRTRTFSDYESYDILLLHSEHDVESDIFRDINTIFNKLTLSSISMHELPLGKDKFSIVEDMLDKCSYTMCLLTANFLADNWCYKHVVQACERAVREDLSTVLFVKANGFRQVDIPPALKGIQGAEHGSWAFEKVLKNTFKPYLKKKAEENQASQSASQLMFGAEESAGDEDFVDAETSDVGQEENIMGAQDPDISSTACAPNTALPGDDSVDTSKSVNNLGDQNQSAATNMTADEKPQKHEEGDVEAHDTSPVPVTTSSQISSLPDDDTDNQSSDANSGNQNQNAASNKNANEKSLSDASPDLNQKKKKSGLQLPGFGKKKKKKVIRIEYDIENPIVRETTVIDTTIMINKNLTSIDQPGGGSLNYAQEFTNTYEFHWRNATNISGDAQLKTGIPFIAEGKLKLGLSNTFYIGKKKTEANKTIKGLTFDYPAAAAPGKETHTKVTVKKHTIEIPFTAELEGGGTEEGTFKSVRYEVASSCEEVAAHNEPKNVEKDSHTE